MTNATATPFYQLVTENMTRTVTGSMMDILRAMLAYEKLKDLASFKKNRPRTRQDIEFLDEMTGSAITEKEVDRIKQAVLRMALVSGDIGSRNIYTADELEAMAAEELDAVKKCFSFVTSTVFGKSYMAQLVKLEVAYGVILRHGPIDQPWTVYTAHRLFRALQDTRHQFLTSSAPLGLYSRALALYCDFITNTELVIASINTSGVSRTREAEYSDVRSRQEVTEMIEMFDRLPHRTQLGLLRKFEAKENSTFHENLVLGRLRDSYHFHFAEKVKVDQN